MYISLDVHILNLFYNNYKITALASIEMQHSVSIRHGSNINTDESANKKLCAIKS